MTGRMMRRAAALSVAAAGIVSGEVRAATPSYDFNAAADAPGNNVWQNELTPTSARQFTFTPSAATSPVDVTSPGTLLTKAYEFGSGVTGATAPSFNGSDIGTDAAAFEVWFKPATPLGSAQQVLFESGGATHGASLLLDGQSVVYATAFNNAYLQAAYALPTASPSDFLQVIGVNDTVSNQTLLYLNGQLVGGVAGTKNWSQGGDNAGIATNANVTGGLANSFGNFSGQIARARLYGGVFTGFDAFQSFHQLSTATVDPWTDRVLASSPASYWRLSEPAGAPLASNLGTGTAGGGIGPYTGGVTLGQPGLVNSGGNTAADFDGVDDIVKPGNSGDINSGGDYPQKTVELFMRPDTIPADAATYAVAYEQGGGTNGLNVYLSDNKIFAGSWVGSQTNFLNTQGVQATAGSTYYVVLTHDTTRNRVMGFLNGALFDAKTVGSLSVIPTHTGVIGIGGTNNDGRFGGTVVAADGDYFDGTLDEVATYNAALSFAEVQSRYLSTGGDLGITPGATLGIALNYDAANLSAAATFPDSVGTIARGGVPGDFTWQLASATLLDTNVSSFPGITKSLSFSGSGAGGLVAGGTGRDSLDGTELVPGGLDTRNASIEIWFKPLDITGKEVLIETGGSTTGSSIRLNGDVVELATQAAAGTSALLTADLDADNAGGIDNTDFIQIVAVFDVENDKLHLYQDGYLVDSADYLGDDWSGNDAMALGRIGGSAIGAGGSGFGAFAGELAIVRYYPEALSGNEVLNNFAAITGVPEPGAALTLAAGGLLLMSRRRRRTNVFKA